MNSSFSLTEGAALMIQSCNSNPEVPDPFKQPVMQVVKVAAMEPTAKPGQPPPQQQTTRYRLLLSDGMHMFQVMAATQLNTKVSSLDKGDIIKLTNFVINVVTNKKIIILLGFDVLASSVPRIGNPVPVDQASNQGQVNPQLQQPQQQLAQSNQQYQQQPPGYQQQNQFGVQNNQNNQFGQINQFGRQNVNRAPTTSARSGFGQQPIQPQYQQTMQQPYQQPQRNTIGNDVRIFPITSLSPYQNKWTIKARLINKTDIKTWTNQKGSGRLFSATFSDESGEIRATGFNEAVDRLYDDLQENSVYYISGCSIKFANKKFSNVNNEYEMHFESGSLVELCPDGGNVPGVKYNFVGLGRLMEFEKDSMIDVIGVVKDVSELGTITSKASQKAFSKREITIVDESQHAVKLTLWGKQAESFDSNDVVIAVKGAKVSDFQGRTLSMVSSGTMQINPDIPEAHRVRGWYDTVGHCSEFAAYHGGSFGEGGHGEAKFKTINEAKEERLGFEEKPDYFGLRAMLVYAKQDSFYYPACSNGSCNKKVFEEADGWRCEKCNIVNPQPTYRYVLQITLADHSGQIYASVFNDHGEILLGASCNEMVELQNTDPQQFESRWSNCLFTDNVFRVRAKAEMYQDEMRVKYTIVGLSVPDSITIANQMVDLIEQYA